MDIFYPYVPIVDELQGYFSELPDGHIVDIEIFYPYVLIVDELQGDLS
jgi:hypothetical protein